MFNLSKALDDWRNQMVSEGIRPGFVLDELESHLREEVENQIGMGTPGEQAFQMAIASLGHGIELKNEFRRAGELDMANKFKEAVLVFAGIPEPSLEGAGGSGDFRIEPGWVTYLKTILFLGPAISLWMLLAIFVIPKVQEICKMAGLPDQSFFWKMTQLSIYSTLRFTQNFGYVLVLAISIFGLLEWYSPHWPRFRRSTISTGAFVFNAIVLVSIFIIMTALVIAAPAMAHPH
jgi:hypothetical protein